MKRVALMGLPFDEASSFLRGAARGPTAIRAALHSKSSNLWTEHGVDLGAASALDDLGDLELADARTSRARIEAAVSAELEAGSAVLALGGDHSVSYPILRSFAARYPDLSIVQVDAHPDLYDEFEGDRYSHACPFARVMEEGLAKRLVQIGIRTANRHQLEQAERLGVEIVPRHAWSNLGALDLQPPVYLSIDLDGLDPAFAPGVSHPEAGGLSTPAVLEIVWSVPGLVGADVVELNPDRDPAELTARAAAKLVKELAARLLES